MNTSSEDKPPAETLRPRGMDMKLPHGGLPEVLSMHLIKLIQHTGGVTGPIGKQFVAQPTKERLHAKKGSKDPLIEDEHEVTPGLVYKYEGVINSDGTIDHYGRVLWTVTRFCASYCRFCTRGREVGMPVNTMTTSHAAIAQNPYLTDTEIAKVLAFLKSHPEINEIIVSGGDPMATPQHYLTKIISGLVKLQKSGDLDIIRVGTRLPVHNPISFKDWHYELLSTVKNPYLMVHINHPAELTPETLAVLYNFRKRSLATVMSQTVLLKGVNDSIKTLHELFVTLAKEGIRPYYVFQNDPVYWAQHFTVPIKQAIKLWQNLRPKLSGVAATARFVIDTPFGFGKVAVPEGGSWNVDYDNYIDFRGKKHKTVLDEQ